VYVSVHAVGVTDADVETVLDGGDERSEDADADWKERGEEGKDKVLGVDKSVEVPSKPEGMVVEAAPLCPGVLLAAAADVAEPEFCGMVLGDPENEEDSTELAGTELDTAVLLDPAIFVPET